MTETMFHKKKIAIIGGGPSGLFMYKSLIEKGNPEISIDIFEAKKIAGAGMPYSSDGANTEHVTNVSGNEIPKIITTLLEWIQELTESELERYGLEKEKVHEFMVVPRLLFGEYLISQFNLLKNQADERGFATQLHFSIKIVDIIDNNITKKIIVKQQDNTHQEFDHVIICTGHHWPSKYEGNITGYFESPYPPSKLQQVINHPIAIRGSSLTAIDAVRTLARANGSFSEDDHGMLVFNIAKGSPAFSIDMYSRHGLLPAIRFHLDNPRLTNKSLLTKEEIERHIANNEGFLSLDFIFEKDFKNLFIEKDPAFYSQIKDLSVEDFVDLMMSLRESIDPFLLFKGEYEEARKSIKRKQSVYWKEMLGVLSFAMNHPAKHLSAEDMNRLSKVLMPLISVVIAYVPQSSVEELIALHDAGCLNLIAAGDDSEVEPKPEGGIVYHYTDETGEIKNTPYKTFIDCIGQKHLSVDDFPFPSMVSGGVVSQAKIRYRNPQKAAQGDRDETGENGQVFLKVPGIAITDSFRAVMKNGESNGKIHVMAVPYIGGFNPDYSGLDFCEAASQIIAQDILKT